MNDNKHNVSLYDFQGQQVRVVELDGCPWFVAADICRVLDVYVKADGTVNTWNALRGLPNEQHKVIDTPSQRGGKITILSEGALYRLVMRSNVPEAKDFQNWIACEVLPTIRKDGMYVKGEGGKVSPREPATFFAKNLYHHSYIPRYTKTPRTPSDALYMSGPTALPIRGDFIFDCWYRKRLGHEQAPPSVAVMGKAWRGRGWMMDALGKTRESPEDVTATEKAAVI